MMKKQIFIRVTAIVVLIIFILITVASVGLAKNGEGSNNSNSLKLEASIPGDGETNVPLDSEIVLKFNKNVVNMSIKDNNMNCILLKDSEGNNVENEVIMADDQMERERRNDITIRPKEDLKPREKYTVIISKDLTSKSGVSLDNDIKITFQTESQGSINLFFYIYLLWLTVVIISIFVIFLIKRKVKKIKQRELKEKEMAENEDN
jgi:ABC-type lipoprotein release transport system permease subunit